jgi:hypothetical protein
MKVNRESLLKELQAVQPGLTTREIIEQSSCFVFKKHQVITYNDEIACSHPSCLHIKGAVSATSFISILQKLDDEYLTVEITKGELILSGKHKRLGLRMENEILLPINDLEIPEQWNDLPEDYTDAVKKVQHCAGRDESQFITTCIHITPDFIEACDNYQLGRYRIKTGVKDSVLVRRDSLKRIVEFDMTLFGETENWLHFKNPTDLVLSCRKYLEDYPSDGLTKHLQEKGVKTKLPKGIKSAIEKAEVFSMENIEDNYVTVDLSRDKLKIKGKGVSGWYYEKKKARYKGSEISFTIAPQLLSDLSQNFDECEVTKDKLKVESGKFSYVAVLNPITKKKKKNKKT